jgi:DNA ligase-associated metallophosphoesterase
MNAVQFSCAGETLDLLAGRAAFWAKQKTLFVADTHFGKASAFRHAGIAVPEQVTDADLLRLSNLLAHTSAERLVILGDLFHARTGKSPATICAVDRWRKEHAQLQIDLLLGNHDLATGALPVEWNIRTADELREPPFVFAHNARPVKNHFGLFGHVHPAIRVDRLRLSCFHFWNDGGCLPAFGSFTGVHCLYPEPGDTIFGVQADDIIKISSRVWNR